MHNKINLNVGFNWKLDTALGLIALNKMYKNENIQVDTVYGSTRDALIMSARPKCRVPEIDAKNFQALSKMLSDNNIGINYTINCSCVGDVDKFLRNEHQIVEWLEYLSGFCTKFTVANPVVLHLIQGRVPSIKNIELSTIMQIDDLNTLQKYSLFFSAVKSFCVPINKNRDFVFLKKVAALENAPKPEVLVNEFCNIAGASCHGMYRNSCYNAHSHDSTNGVSKYPMRYCTEARKEHPNSWVKAPFILPQWLDTYANFGIKNFKISGRTHTSEYILTTVERYMSKKYHGNLLELWGMLEKIEGNYHKEEYPSISSLELTRMIDVLQKSTQPCGNKLCGIECNICEAFFKKALQ